MFFYIYGLLHSQEYRERFAADLTRLLPRIPLVDVAMPFIVAGRALFELHTGYETVDCYPLAGLDAEPAGELYDFFRVTKMQPVKVRKNGGLVRDPSGIKINSHITVTGIPEDAYRYMLGSRSAVDWLIDRFQVRTDAASGIVNDPNDWSHDLGEPRYILDLVARVVTVSVETMKIVDSLPPLDVLEPQPK